MVNTAFTQITGKYKMETINRINIMSVKPHQLSVYMQSTTAHIENTMKTTGNDAMKSMELNTVFI